MCALFLLSNNQNEALNWLYNFKFYDIFYVSGSTKTPIPDALKLVFYFELIC